MPVPIAAEMESAVRKHVSRHDKKVRLKPAAKAVFSIPLHQLKLVADREPAEAG
jgi:hypothetical protein